MNLKNPQNKYRPIPFWSWNEKLDTVETKRQIEMMANIGMGGYFMHARGGLQTEYMGKEWFENVDVGVSEGKKNNLGAWAYDENGWPSGFGNGFVNGLGVTYQQKYLRMEEGEKETSNTICNKDGIHFYYEVNPFYVDTLDGKVIKEFIDKIYQPYFDKYGNDLEGFFTDEPQISRNGIPWSFIIPEGYKKAYGEDLLPHLVELFKPVGNYEKTRFKFWKLVTDLFSKNYMKQIYTWCENHGLKLTGHLVLEEDLECQLTSNGAAMPHYEYFHIPGMDWLTRNIYPCLSHHQVSSDAHQLGRKQILTESFALCGHNVSFEELKGILEWQMVRGITQLCPHLQGYSLRGIRKRDYPPAMYYQQPWWDEYKTFIDAASRVGMLLTEGAVEYDTLIIHPQSSAWVCFDNGENDGLMDLHQQFLNVIDTLEKKHILFHLGDETIMERHGKVEGNALIIDAQKYKIVVLPPHKILFESTKALLYEFKANGGIIKTAEQLDEIINNDIIDNPFITYTKRIFENYDMYYFVNSTTETRKANISVGNKVLDILTGETHAFNGVYEFSAFDSLVVIDERESREECFPKKQLETLKVDGPWKIKYCSFNAITLDFCDYYFDNELVEKNGYVLNIQNRACELERPVNIRCIYTLKADYLPKEVFLVCETPEHFEIVVNGEFVNKRDCGYFIDNSFRKIDISKYLKYGENTISLSMNFTQSDEVYENLKKSQIFESEKNKLSYDMEIEPIYIVGDFSVGTIGTFSPLERKAIRFNGGFVIQQPKDEIIPINMEQQGFPFFAGKIILSKTLTLTNTNYKIKFNKKGLNVIKVRINNSEQSSLLWEPFEADISHLLRLGENEMEITLINNLRNLLGPHHLEEGESYIVGPHSFFKEQCVWNAGFDIDWNDDYCLVEMSAF